MTECIVLKSSAAALSRFGTAFKVPRSHHWFPIMDRDLPWPRRDGFQEVPHAEVAR